MTNYSLGDLIKLSFRNKSKIENTETKCTCYFCLNQFDKSNITKYIKESNGETAICPICGIDSVLHFEIDENEIRAIRFQNWLDEGESNEL